MTLKTRDIEDPVGPMSMTRRAFLTGGAAFGIGLATYAGTHARHEYEIVRRTFPIRNLPDAFLDLNIVQISDIHLVEYTEAWFLERMVAQVNALQPDLVLVTGDFVSRGPWDKSVGRRAAGTCAEILSTLKAPQRFGIFGNHDISVGPALIADVMRAHGLPILVDSYTPIERGHDHLWLCGSDDAGTRSPNLSMAVPPYPDAPVILMCHEPDFADTVIRHPRFPLIDLMLSGHTHGGQVRLPVVGPLILPPMGKKYIRGLFHFDHMQLYVNRGLGTVGLPFRLNCPAEITQIQLTRA
jgi:predicted MPP superfamily phosphohydrolase